MKLTKLILIIACLALAFQAFAADWPQFRGLKADGMAPDKGINKDWANKPPKLLWQAALTDDGFAGPSVAEGKLFIIDHSGSQDIVRAFNVDTGEEAWRYAYDETDQANYGYSRATPVFSAGKVYTLSRMGTLLCLDAATGQKVWGRNLVSEMQGNKPQWDYAVSPLVDGDKLIVVPGGDKSVAALDKTTGATLWTGGASDVAGYATPVTATILDKRQYVVFTGAMVSGVDSSDGNLLWSYPWKTSYDVNAASPIVGGNYVFMTSGYNVGCALLEITAAGPKKLWANKEIIGQFNTPVRFGKFIYGIGDPGNLVCLDTATGTAAWKQPGFEKGGVCGVDGAVIAINGAEGDVVLVNATETAYQELGRIKPLGGQSWTAPIVANGKLIVRNKQGIACLDLM
jgi:outer membrane protein assembly factor BamB